MEILSKEENRDNKYNQIFSNLIILDLVLISISIIFQISNDALFYIQIFDFFVCILLLGEYVISLSRATSKKDFIFNQKNLLGLVGSIPFDFLMYLFLPVNFPFRILGYLRFLKLFMIFQLPQFNLIKDFFEKTGFHKIMGGIAVIILTFTLLLYISGTSYGIFDDFYFVIVTLTTVGYGDITPQTYNEKILTMILILIGIIVFSTITASISSFLTDRIMDDDNEDDVEKLKKSIEDQSDNIMNELNAVRQQNEKLQKEIDELKDLIKNK